MYSVIIDQEAKIDLNDAALWYELRSTGLGDKFLSAFLNVIDYLEVHAHTYAVIEDDFRQAIMKRYPFVVVYRVIDSEVRIIAVFHTSRNPIKKFKR